MKSPTISILGSEINPVDAAFDNWVQVIATRGD